MAKKRLEQPTSKHPTMKRFNPPDVGGNGVAQGSKSKFPAWLDEGKTISRLKTPRG